MATKVLIVDDSTFFRKRLKEIIDLDYDDNYYIPYCYIGSCYSSYSDYYSSNFYSYKINV